MGQSGGVEALEPLYTTHDIRQTLNCFNLILIISIKQTLQQRRDSPKYCCHRPPRYHLNQAAFHTLSNSGVEPLQRPWHPPGPLFSQTQTDTLWTQTTTMRRLLSSAALQQPLPLAPSQRASTQHCSYAVLRWSLQSPHS